MRNEHSQVYRQSNSQILLAFKFNQTYCLILSPPPKKSALGIEKFQHIKQYGLTRHIK